MRREEGARGGEKRREVVQEGACVQEKKKQDFKRDKRQAEVVRGRERGQG